MDPNKQVQELSKLIQMQQQDKFKKDIVEFYTSIIAKSYDKASTYCQLILMAGYAIFFTFWSNVKGEIGLIDARVSVIYVIISAMFFLVWEMAGMIISALNLKNFYRLTGVPADKFEEQMTKLNKDTEMFEASFTKWWIYQLIITIFFGFAGAIILIIAYMKTLLS